MGAMRVLFEVNAANTRGRAGVMVREDKERAMVRGLGSSYARDLAPTQEPHASTKRTGTLGRGTNCSITSGRDWINRIPLAR